MKSIRLHIRVRARKQLQVRLKRKKLWIHATNNLWNNVMVILVFMNATKKSATQHTDASAQQRITSRNYPWVLFKSFQRTNPTLKTCKIVLWSLNNQKCALRTLNYCKGTLQILPWIVSVYIRRRRKLEMKTTKITIFRQIFTTKVKLIRVHRKTWGDKLKRVQYCLTSKSPI